jgi:hypothetical protein
MLYVAMTRERHNNEAFLYQKFSNEADHEHAKPVQGDAIHQPRRGNKYSATRPLPQTDPAQRRAAPRDARRRARHDVFCARWRYGSRPA